MMDQFELTGVSKELRAIAEKVFSGIRITNEEGIVLYEKGELGFLGLLADFVRRKINDKKTYFIKNIHLEPTNICIYNCRFCSYSKKEGQDGWMLSSDDIVEKVRQLINADIQEIHIVGGVHPDLDVYYYANILNSIKNILPKIHIKAFTAIELEYMIRKSNLTLEHGLQLLKQNGLDSIPGGGAEIFDPIIRQKICSKKPSGEVWLKVHEAAHLLGIPTNATILYGHIENFAHRIDHLEKLRQLQDRTGLFNAFIPLKFRNKNNEFSKIKEVSNIEDLRNYAISRIYLDNFKHIKAYWPMIGKLITQLSLSFGVDDIDGTIDDSTKIYSLAGAEDQSPTMTSSEMSELISQANYLPSERDSLYNLIN